MPAASAKKGAGTAGGKGPATAAAAPAAPGGAHPPQLKRGQAAKLRRIKSKYGEQDEVERRLAMAAIGHDAGALPSTLAVPGATRGSGPPAPLGGDDAAASPAAIAAAASPPAAAAGEAPSRPPRGDNDAGRGPPPLREPRAPKPPRAPAAATADEGEDNEDGGASGGGAEDAARAIASLVAVPRPDDVLLHVLPMVCPYSVALQAKYRVKLTPGALKKGKAAQAVAHLLQEVSGGGGGKPSKSKAVAAVGGAVGGTAREHELIRAFPHDAMVLAVPANCRVTAAPALASDAPAARVGRGGGGGGAAGGGVSR